MSHPVFPNTEIHEGEIIGSKYRIHIPKNQELSNKVIIFCHGYRPIGMKLIAIFDDRQMYRTLLSKGWILCSLSYRKEGYIIKDAIEDVNNLREYVLKKFFSGIEEEKVSFLLDSSSMGGAITTFVAERCPQKYIGAFSIGAALWIDRKKENLEYSYAPKMKVMFVMNSTEVGIIKTYIKRIDQEEMKDNIALWYVNKAGHCDLTDLEIERSFWKFLEWVEGESDGKIEKEYDVTQYTSSKESTVTYDEEKKGSFGKVTEIDTHGIIYLDFMEKDFKRLGLRRGNTFTLELQKTGSMYNFLLGSFPFVGVEEGTLVADCGIEFTKIYRHSVRTMDCNEFVVEMKVEVGDIVFIEEKKPEKARSKISDRMKKMLSQFND